MAESEYDPCPAGDPHVLDIGHDVRIRFTSYGGAERAGLIESHPNGIGPGRCSGAATFRIPETEPLGERPRWKVESLDPLTLSPSLLCRTCAHHGFIRDGVWVPA